jgi:AbrB family looped-hinge helix DNA binding protein
MNEDIFIVVRSKGQIVIPAALREKLGIKAGTRMAIRRLRGSCKGKDSIAAAREREHRREDRIRSQKLAAWLR